jgi:hypothetical protein
MKPGSTTLTEVGSPFYLDKIPTDLSPVTSPSTINAQELLLVSNNQDICTASCALPPNSDNTVSVFTVSSSGALTMQQNRPYLVTAINPVSVMAVNTNPVNQAGLGGLFVYVGSNAQTGGSLYPFQICTVVNAVCNAQAVSVGLLTPLQTCTQQQCIDVAPTAAGQREIPHSPLIISNNAILGGLIICLVMGMSLDFNLLKFPWILIGMALASRRISKSYADINGDV